MPYILLVAAALLLWWVLTNQRGTFKPAGDAAEVSATTEPFVRDTAMLEYTKHALCRMACRFIDEEEVKDILMNGKLNERKIEESEKGITYPLEGITKDKQHVRVVFAPKADDIVVVTAIDLENEWPCECN